MIKKALTIFGFLCSFLFLYLALRKVDLHEVTQALRSVSRAELILALGALVTFNVLIALRWQYLLSHTQIMEFRPVLSAVMIGYFANNVLPARAGEILRAHVLGRRTSLSRTFTFATIVVERLFDVMTMLAILLVIIVRFPLPDLARKVGLGAFILLAVALSVLGIIMFGGDHLSLLLRSPSLHRLFKPLRSRIEPFREGLQTVGQARRLMTVAGLSMLIWLSSALMVYLTLRSLNIDIPTYGVFFTLAFINLGVMIPSSPGFIGTYQFLCINALSFFRVSNHTALAFSLVLHALWYVPVTLVGFIFFTRENLRLSRIASTKEATV